MAATEEVEFRAADLVTHAGSGSNGEKLVGVLSVHSSRELKAPFEKRINVNLDSKVDRESVAKLLGVKRVETCHVRGGDHDENEAMVTYVWLDDRGTVWKGAFPYGDVAKGRLSDDTHVSQKRLLQTSSIAQQHTRENPRPQQQAKADPFALADMDAAELVALMDEHPERADMIKAVEKAGKGRKTVLEHKPASASDDEDSN